MGFFDKLFGTRSERELKRIQPILDKVLSYDEEYSKLSEEELKGKTAEFKERLANGESLDDILPEAFATVREASWRVLGMKHYPVQILGGIVLHQGRIAEQKTGEGKANPVDTPVPTPYGWKVVGDIKVGDYLFDRYGKPTKVLSVHPQGVIDTYEVTLADGRKVKCADEHLWSVYANNSDSLTTLNTVTLMQNVIKSYSGYNYSLPMNHVVEYKSGNFDVDPYLYGSALSNNGHREISTTYKVSSEGQRFALIQGLMDTDGFIETDEYDLVYRTTSRKLATDFMEVIYSLGYSCYLRTDVDGQYEVYIDVPNAIKYKFFRTESKVNLALEAKDIADDKDYSRIAIVDIQKLEKKSEQVCFVVDNEEHLFLVGEYVVTHNTLTATAPVYLNALEGKGSFVVTVNDYLAKRDSAMMGKVYAYLGLTTGLITHEKSVDERREAYNCDITYATNNEIGFDYLRDNMVYNTADKVQRGFNYAIVDEVDSILIDEARTPLIISGASGESDDGYKIANEFVKTLKGKRIAEIDLGNKLDLAAAALNGDGLEEQYADYDYVVEEKQKVVTLTSKGISKAEKFYNIDNFNDIENLEINHYVTRALKAYGLFKKDVDYVIKDGEIVIVDESTGRLMEGRRYSDGIHQAIEAKENVNIKKESRTLASITFQNLFRKFKKLSGMTGTALTEEEEFKTIYGLDVVEISTNKPVIRMDKEDKVFIHRDAKLRAIVEKVKECHEKGQPILVGTVSVEKSEELSKLLKKEHIKHTVLNAKYHEQEAHIIAQAGKLGSVTIATNMAGRGTDIILGGNPEYIALEELTAEGYPEELVNEATSYAYTDNEDIINIRALFREKEDRIKKELSEEVQKVRDAGGLYVLGTERHESRRIDNQLRGRSGRQGDPGASEFMLSMEDDLLRLFGSHKFIDMCQMLDLDDDTPLDAKMLSNNIEKAQRRIESQYFAVRKSVFEYDEVMAQQRDVIYDERNKILENDINYREIISKMMKEILIKGISPIISNLSENITQEMIDELNEKFKDYEALHLNYEDLSAVTYQSIEEDLNNRIDASLDKLQGANSEQDFNSFAQRVLLFELDSCWQEHMINLDSLKQGVGLNAYGNKNPVEEFKMESFNLFEEMMDCVRSEVLDVYLKMASKPLKPEKKKSSFTIVRIDKPDVTDGKNDVVACEETEE